MRVSAYRGDGVSFGVSWEDRKKGTLVAAILAILVVLATPRPLGLAPGGHDAASISVIVRAVPGAEASVAAAVRDAGGTVVRRIGLIHGLVAQVPRPVLGQIAAASGVIALTPDSPVRLLSDGWKAENDPGSMLSTSKVTGARDMWRAGYTGDGVDVALIDSGVAPVPGLDGSGKVLDAADFSFDYLSQELRYRDSFGHGTHMAGIIAGRDASVGPGKENEDKKSFMGMAPGARIVNVKVAATNGVTDVSQVIAAIDWVVRHRSDPGVNVKVLSLSFGTDGRQSYLIDPLAYAAEMAWHEGIVVVVAAGNAGFGDQSLNDPAFDPYVLAVGANDTGGTYPTNDDTVPDWSSRGDGARHPDLVAPGVSVASLRDPGSFVDAAYPEAAVGDRFFRGTGTSQAAAVVSGAVALVEEQRPGITPDEVKALLMGTASPLPDADAWAQGAGELNLKAAMKAKTPNAVQTWPEADGTGSLEGSRGSVHVVGPDGVELTGEVDVFGRPWECLRWSDADWSGLRWSGLTWSGLRWSDLTWSGLRWSGLRWSDMNWDGLRWSGLRWSGLRWSGLRWSGIRWG